ncbi:MAG: tRNA (adenosine(37)-N6)-threonylcarbamoyltransferase complex ATPase subunit type 1 TsaE [Bacillota bacterium]
MVCVITKQEKETEYVGQRMAKYLEPGDFIALIGQLGAGKTVFSKGIARGLGIEEDITSPTFTIIHEYTNGRIPLFHMDVYRLKDVQEMDDLGYEEYFYGNGVTVVEWADIIRDILPAEHLALVFNQGEEGREICFYPQGEKYKRLVEELTGHDYSKHR